MGAWDEAEPGQPFPDGVRIESLLPHMHLLGRSIELVAVQPDGETVLVDVPSYDFAWQREYALRTPLLLGPEDELRIRCTFDNTAGTGP